MEKEEPTQAPQDTTEEVRKDTGSDQQELSPPSQGQVQSTMEETGSEKKDGEDIVNVVDDEELPEAAQGQASKESARTPTPDTATNSPESYEDQDRRRSTIMAPWEKEALDARKRRRCEDHFHQRLMRQSREGAPGATMTNACPNVSSMLNMPSLMDESGGAVSVTNNSAVSVGPAPAHREQLTPPDQTVQFANLRYRIEAGPPGVSPKISVVNADPVANGGTAGSATWPTVKRRRKQARPAAFTATSGGNGQAKEASPTASGSSDSSNEERMNNINPTGNEVAIIDAVDRREAPNMTDQLRHQQQLQYNSQQREEHRRLHQLQSQDRREQQQRQQQQQPRWILPRAQGQQQGSIHPNWRPTTEVTQRGPQPDTTPRAQFQMPGMQVPVLLPRPLLAVFTTGIKVGGGWEHFAVVTMTFKTYQTLTPTPAIAPVENNSQLTKEGRLALEGIENERLFRLRYNAFDHYQLNRVFDQLSGGFAAMNNHSIEDAIRAERPIIRMVYLTLGAVERNLAYEHRETLSKWSPHVVILARVVTKSGEKGAPTVTFHAVPRDLTHQGVTSAITVDAQPDKKTGSFTAKVFRSIPTLPLVTPVTHIKALDA